MKLSPIKPIPPQPSLHCSTALVGTMTGRIAGRSSRIRRKAAVWSWGVLWTLLAMPNLVFARPVIERKPLRASETTATPVWVIGISLGNTRAPDLRRVEKDVPGIMTEELKAAGYDAREPKPGKEPSGPQFMLGGQVQGFDCSEAQGKTCGITIEWAVLDVAADALVYRMRARHEEADYSSMSRSDAARALFRGAFRSLLSREKFKQTMEHPGATYEKRLSPAELASCSPRKLKMPTDAETVLDATAVVRTKEGIGSAVSVSPDGYYLTAAHVVAGSEKKGVTVIPRGGEEHEALVVRYDQASDVALLRLKKPKDKMACLALGAADPKAGEDVYVIGAPAGEELSFSLSRGILSGKRKISGKDYLQTDASINPGNSGGPLLDGEAEVVGIVSWKMSGTALEGLGFAVQIQSAMQALALSPSGRTSDSLLDERAETNQLKEPTVDRADGEWTIVGQDSRSRRKGSSNWAGPVLGAGISAVVLGGATIGLTAAVHNPSTLDPGAQSTASTMYALGGVMVGVGAAAILTAVLVPAFSKGDTSATAGDGAGSRSVRVAPVVGPTYLGLGVQY